MDAVWPYVAAILPTILVAILFYFLIKSMLEGDRRERLAQRRFEAEQDRRSDPAAQRNRTADGLNGAPRRPTGEEIHPGNPAADLPVFTNALSFGEAAANVFSGIETLRRFRSKNP